MEKHTIGGLKKILVAATKFYEIQDYFLTLTETNRSVMNGKLGKNKVLKDILSTTLASTCLMQGIISPSDKFTLVNMMMIEVRERYFWHGSGFVNGKYIFTFFYFADLDKGMVSISQTDGMNYFSRISIKSAQKEDPSAAFSSN